MRGQACGRAVTGGGEQQRALAGRHRSPLMSTGAAAANGGTPGVKGKRGGDYQPKGLNSCWTAQSPQGDDALERSVNQMRGKIQCLMP